MMRDKLDEIMAAKREEITSRRRPVRDDELIRLSQSGPPVQMLTDRIRSADELGVIAEVKRRSPSAGVIAAEGLDPVEQARRYYNGGAAAISVLTDEVYFGGSLRDLWDVADLLNPRADGPPILRKDFFVDPIQIVEAREAGARLILIIVRALSDEEIRRLQGAATLAGMEALFEVHSEAELERALRFDPELVGVNNRDLQRFHTDLAITESLVPQIPDGIARISESGIFTVEDAARVKAAGADAILVGEALMKADDPEELLHDLRMA
jgi:indole-3-glycerol phosphate synthase